MPQTMAKVSSTTPDRMTPSTTHSKTRWGVYAALAVALVVSLWLGWGESELLMTQAEIRGGIRAWVQLLIRTAIQYAIPAVILGFFAKEAYAWRASQPSKGN
ncbi:MAG: hypothetical protein AAFV01_09350 [Bacteroidota bacterium]